MMKFGVLLGLFLVCSQVTADFCYNDAEGACSTRPIPSDKPLLANCNAKYGRIDDLLTDLQGYASAHLQTSYEFLLMSSHFGNYETNREGFKGLYRKLSDDAWSNAIDVMKFIAKRGGFMNFNQLPHFKRNDKEHVFELNELNSLAKALDVEKQLADEALRIHNQAQQHNMLDASVAHYLEEKFIEDQAETVRNLAGHTNDLKNFLRDSDPSLAVFLFDEYLQKTLI